MNITIEKDPTGYRAYWRSGKVYCMVAPSHKMLTNFANGREVNEELVREYVRAIENDKLKKIDNI